MDNGLMDLVSGVLVGVAFGVALWCWRVWRAGRGR